MRRAGTFAACALCCLAAATTGDWTTFKSTAGRFSVSLPGEPTTVKVPLQVKNQKLTLHAFVHELQDKFGYAVVYCDLPAEPMAASDPLVVLERFYTAQVKKQNGKLLSESRIKLKGNPGMEFSYQTADGMAALCRAYIVKNRIYETALIGPQSGTPPTNYAKFFDSFKVN